MIGGRSPAINAMRRVLVLLIQWEARHRPSHPSHCKAEKTRWRPGTARSRHYTTSRLLPRQCPLPGQRGDKSRACTCPTATPTKIAHMACTCSYCHPDTSDGLHARHPHRALTNTLCLALLTSMFAAHTEYQRQRTGNTRPPAPRTSGPAKDSVIMANELVFFF